MIHPPTCRTADFFVLRSPSLPLGTKDATGNAVAPQSLYLAQLAERLGAQALKNIEY